MHRRAAVIGPKTSEMFVILVIHMVTRTCELHLKRKFNACLSVVSCLRKDL